MKNPPKRKNRPGAGRPKGSAKAPTERLHIRLPLGTVDALKQKAAAAGMTVNELMSSWLD